MIDDNQSFDEYCNIDFPIAHKEKLENSVFRVVCDGLVCLADDIFRYGLETSLYGTLLSESHRHFQGLVSPLVRIASMMHYWVRF